MTTERQTVGFGCVGNTGPIIYTNIMLENQHWTRLLSGFTSKKQAREYIEKTYPGVEVITVEDFNKRSHEQMHQLGVRSGVLEPEKIKPDPLPEGDVATIVSQDGRFTLLLLQGTKQRAISGLLTEEETEEMWEGLYKKYQLITNDVFEKVKRKRGVA